MTWPPVVERWNPCLLTRFDEWYDCATLKKPIYAKIQIPELLTIFGKEEILPLAVRFIGEYRHSLVELERDLVHIRCEPKWLEGVFRGFKQQEIDAVKKKLYYWLQMKDRCMGTYTQQGKVNADDILRAKQVPFSALLGEPKRSNGTSAAYLCPFTGEKTPSFTIFKQNNTFKCFGGCQEQGDIIDFYRKLNDVGFLEAVKKLLEYA